MSQNFRNQFFVTILVFMLDNGRIRIRISDLWIRIREAYKHMDPTDSYPQHCFLCSVLAFSFIRGLLFTT
jgi:hypothetical protein